MSAGRRTHFLRTGRKEAAAARAVRARLRPPAGRPADRVRTSIDRARSPDPRGPIDLPGVWRPNCGLGRRARGRSRGAYARIAPGGRSTLNCSPRFCNRTGVRTHRCMCSLNVLAYGFDAQAAVCASLTLPTTLRFGPRTRNRNLRLVMCPTDASPTPPLSLTPPFSGTNGWHGGAAQFSLPWQTLNMHKEPNKIYQPENSERLELSGTDLCKKHVWPY